MAVKQGNQLQMQVHEGYRVVEEALPPIGTEKRPVARTGKKPLAHYSSLVRVLGSDMKTPEDPATQVQRERPIYDFSDLCFIVSGLRFELFFRGLGVNCDHLCLTF